MCFLLCAWKGGFQTLLDELFESLTGQARRKLKASAFEALNEHLLPLLESHWPEPRWRGFRLAAADATTLYLPNNPKIQAEFGVQADRYG